MSSSYEFCKDFSETHDTDVWILNSALYGASCSAWYADPDWPPNPRDKACLVLITHGGDPTVAYRIARRLKALYSENLTILVPSECFSGGTLIALAAQDLVIFDSGVLGPMDIQVRKDDEWDEWTSGLTVTEALEALTTEVFKSFQSIAVSLRTHSRGQITSRTAMEMAASIIPGLYGPVYRQIDPMRLGEHYRSNKIMKEYGSRLLAVDQDKKAKNSADAKTKCLDRLVGEYPSHGFVIDREEAKQIFKGVIENVREPTDEEKALVNALAPMSRIVFDYPGFLYCFHSDASNTNVNEGQSEENDDDNKSDNAEPASDQGDSEPSENG